MERLGSLSGGPLEEVKALRRWYDKRLGLYEGARSRHLSLAADSKPAVLFAAEEELAHKKARFDQARLGLAACLQTLHTTRRCAFAEACALAGAAHARLFAAACALAQRKEGARERLLAATAAERAHCTLAAAALASSSSAGAAQHRRSSSGGAALSDEELEWEQCGPLSRAPAALPLGRATGLAMAAAASQGTVVVLKQGYLLKQSSSLYGDWKRRFFVLTSSGELHYWRDGWMAGGSVLERLKAGSRQGGPLSQGPSAPAPLALLTSTCKPGAGDAAPPLRFCFRVVSPCKTLTLQAENAGEQREWMEAILGCIAELLATHSEHTPPRARASPPPAAPPSASPGSSFVAAPRRGWDLDALAGLPVPSLGASPAPKGSHRRSSSLGAEAEAALALGGACAPSALETVRGVSGNDACADCGAPAPDWASLNLTALLCLRCSGAHRALGCQVSQVRSLTLDVRAWDAAALECFQLGGNARLNALLEVRMDALHKPRPDAAPEALAAFAVAKYAERRWLAPAATLNAPAMLRRAVACGDAAAALGALMAGAAPGAPFLADKQAAEGCEDQPARPPARRASQGGAESPRALLTAHAAAAAGRGLLHVAAAAGQPVLVQLLLQFGARLEAADADGCTALHLACAAAAGGPAAAGAVECAKRLLQRGADAHARDRAGRTPLQAAGQTPDAGLFAALLQAPACAPVHRSDSAPTAVHSPSSAAKAPGHRRLGSSDVFFGSLGGIFGRGGGAVTRTAPEHAFAAVAPSPEAAQPALVKARSLPKQFSTL